jgi:hypothetical protein
MAITLYISDLAIDKRRFISYICRKAIYHQDSGFSGRYIIYRVSIAFSIENLMGLEVENTLAKKRYLLKGVGGKIRV